MTTLEEQICLMEWLRLAGGIGNDCRGDDDLYDHPPERCPEETREYFEGFAGALRDKDSVLEHVYWTLRQASKKAWTARYGEHWSDGRVMSSRVARYLDQGALHPSDDGGVPPSPVSRTGGPCPITRTPWTWPYMYQQPAAPRRRRPGMHHPGD